jgi:uncharacterized membrane protein (UPF0182 family)
MMNWFTLAIRVLGVWALVKAFEYALTGFDIVTGMYRPNFEYTLGGAMTHMFGFFFLGALLVRYAPKIAARFEAISGADKAGSNSADDAPARSPRETFTTAVRIFGIWLLLRTVEYWIEAFDILTKFYKPTHETIGICFTHIVAYFALGYYFVRGAPGIVEFIFPEVVGRHSSEKSVEQKKHEI